MSLETVYFPAGYDPHRAAASFARSCYPGLPIVLDALDRTLVRWGVWEQRGPDEPVRRLCDVAWNGFEWLRLSEGSR